MSTLSKWTTTSDLVAVRRLLLEADDPEVCGPAPQQRYRRHRKPATLSMPWLLLSATAIGQQEPRNGAFSYPRELECRSPLADRADRSRLASRHEQAGCPQLRPELWSDGRSSLNDSAELATDQVWGPDDLDALLSLFFSSVHGQPEHEDEGGR
jgi:hypothetical protein